jgi:Ca-activated chloride channel family protein
MRWPIAEVCLFACSVAALAQTPVFRSDTTLQSIAVQVTDKQGNAVKGLAAADFTLLEDGRPQKIAFFGAGKQPISLAILLDSSTSMSYGGKLERAGTLLGPLLRGNHPDDEIFLVPFTDHLQPLGHSDPFTQLTAAQRLLPPVVKAVETGGGTAFYDALASALCHLRTAQNVRQAVVVITDGADQNSRLRLDQLIQLTRSSSAQVFTIGFFEKSEYEIFHGSGKTVTLVGERDIDNPVVVFDRLARESGAESFFPSSKRGLEQALDRISAILEAQYTLAYYPSDASRLRRIEVKVRRGGVNVLSRRGIGADAEGGPVHFEASSCEVSAKDHLYPWELRISHDPSGAMTWHDDFSDPRTGWPNRREQIPRARYTSPRNREVEGGSAEWKPGVRYLPGGYELSNTAAGGPAVASVVAQGPFWEDFHASVLVEGIPGSTPGLVFHLGTNGYYAVLLNRVESGVNFMLVRRNFSSAVENAIVPWTKIVGPAALQKQRKLSVQYRHGRIDIMVDDQTVSTVEDTTFPSGLTGLALFGRGHAVFHDLSVEELP